MKRLWAALLLAASSIAAAELDWWRNAVIYEVYPRSFADSNGDGIGDLNGITQHLDYLKSLGVDAIWITPFYPSPQVDFGYDISDYRSIDPQFGTMADFDRLLKEANKRGLKVINDMVLNHTSDQHPWFRQSRASRKNSKADWYVWHDPGKGGGPPNNWQSIFGHSAWTLDQNRKQYYYHAFYKEQPDLNWRSKEMRTAMYDSLRFWLDKGVAGYRMDAITSLFEDAAFRDEGYLDGTNAFGDRVVSRQYTDNLPEVHEVLRELRRLTNEYPGRVLIGETYLPNISELAKMYGANQDEFQLPMDLQFGFANKLDARLLRQKLQEAETMLNGNIPLFVFENHDNPRSLERYGDGVHDAAIAKLLATLLLTPRASALIYYGEEIGMRTQTPKRVEDVRDPVGKVGWPKEKGRDGERTPMQWSGGRNAGFTNGTSTWLPVADNFRNVNVEAESGKADSLLNYYKKLIRLRKENEELRDGDCVVLDDGSQAVLSFLRVTRGGKAVLVAVNLTETPQTVRVDLWKQGVQGKHAKMLTGWGASLESGQVDRVMLGAFASFVGQVE